MTTPRPAGFLAACCGLTLLLWSLGCHAESHLPPGGAADDAESRQETSDENSPGAAADAADDVIAGAAGPISLESGASSFTLDQATRRGGGLRSALESLETGERLHLVLHDLRADEPPGVLYHLYLGLGDGEQPADDDPRRLGTVNFFGAVPERPGFYSFDLSRAARFLEERGELDRPITITVLPAGTPAAEAKPVVGRAELVVDPPR